MKNIKHKNVEKNKPNSHKIIRFNSFYDFCPSVLNTLSQSIIKQIPISCHFAKTTSFKIVSNP